MIPQDRSTHGHRARAGARRPAAAAAHRQAGQAQRHPDALATALEGRGRAARREPRAGRRLLHPTSTRSCPRIKDDIAGLADVAADLRRRRPRPGADAAQLRGHHEHHQGQVGRRYAGLPRRHRRLRHAPPGSCSRRTTTGSSELAAVGRPTLGAAGAVLPGVPLPAPGPDPVQRLHRQDLRQRRAAHHPRGRPQRPASTTSRARSPPGARTADPTATACPSPPRPWPGNHFRDGTRRRRQRATSVVPGFLRRPAERARRRPRRSSAVVGRPGGAADGRAGRPRCRTSRRCCSGRWPRGTAVRQSMKTPPSLDQAGHLHRRDGARHRPARPPPSATSRFGGTDGLPARCSPTPPACSRATTSASPACGSARSTASRSHAAATGRWPR